MISDVGLTSNTGQKRRQQVHMLRMVQHRIYRHADAVTRKVKEFRRERSSGETTRLSHMPFSIPDKSQGIRIYYDSGGFFAAVL